MQTIYNILYSGGYVQGGRTRLFWNKNGMYEVLTTKNRFGTGNYSITLYCDYHEEEAVEIFIKNEHGE